MKFFPKMNGHCIVFYNFFEKSKKLDFGNFLLKIFMNLIRNFWSKLKITAHCFFRIFFWKIVCQFSQKNPKNFGNILLKIFTNCIRNFWNKLKITAHCFLKILVRLGPPLYTLFVTSNQFKPLRFYFSL